MLGRLSTILAVAAAGSTIAAMGIAVNAFASVPAKADPALTSYVRQHQPWLKLQHRGVERFYDGDSSDTSFFVFTTMAPSTNRRTAQRACESVAADLRALHLPLSLSILGRPEATLAAYSSHISCTQPIGGAGSGGYFVVSPIH
jgi:hypothetical protein